VSPQRSRYADLSRAELAALVPELLLIGQLVDRSGMPWCIESFGRDGMLEIAIEEWAGASPVYTRRMQTALGYQGEDVITIFKGLQLDIGAPPQFMDFRFTVHDRWHGEFHLDHCGALLDVEPMGSDYVTGMCHDIEDPTFDATAAATNPRAQVRPVHRPPRRPADRVPHCAWTVSIDDSHPPATAIPAAHQVARSRAANWELEPIDPADEGACDYAGPLMSDIDFASFSHSALVRIAEEVCLQMHLLYLSFAIAVRARTAGEVGEVGRAREICAKQLTGIAGVAAERIRRALALPGGVDGLIAVLRLHPLFNPAGYVLTGIGEGRLEVHPSPAHDDGAWISLCTPAAAQPLQAIATAVDPHLAVRVTGSDTEWTAEFDTVPAPLAESPEVQVTKFSRGVDFTFAPRRSLPLTAL